MHLGIQGNWLEPSGFIVALLLCRSSCDGAVYRATERGVSTVDILPQSSEETVHQDKQEAGF